MEKLKDPSTAHMLLNMANAYAQKYSGCCKTAVGSALVDTLIRPKLAIFGANVTLPHKCTQIGCLRVEKYGEASKSHRNPEDCRALHSEIDAICNAAKLGVNPEGKCIVVTRYPCESCAKSIIRAGIKHVIYGREFPISDQTAYMFEAAGVRVTWISDWSPAGDTDTNY